MKSINVIKAIYQLVSVIECKQSHVSGNCPRKEKLVSY